MHTATDFVSISRSHCDLRKSSGGNIKVPFHVPRVPKSLFSVWHKGEGEEGVEAKDEKKSKIAICGVTYFCMAPLWSGRFHPLPLLYHYWITYCRAIQDMWRLYTLVHESDPFDVLLPFLETLTGNNNMKSNIRWITMQSIRNHWRHIRIIFSLCDVNVRNNVYSTGRSKFRTSWYSIRCQYFKISCFFLLSL